jgi:hypothetical protein
MLLEHLYDVYKADISTLKPTTVEWPAVGTSVFLDAIQNLLPAQQHAAISEPESFFNGTYPCLDGNALLWWKVITLSLI